MPFTKAEQKAIQNWMVAHNVRGECPACGSQDGWDIAEHMISPLDAIPSGKKKFNLEPSKLGMVAMACKQCRYIRMFAAGPVLGL